jgi:hypothetical protein
MLMVAQGVLAVIPAQIVQLPAPTQPVVYMVALEVQIILVQALEAVLFVLFGVLVDYAAHRLSPPQM